jgi:hypothetical protein
MSLINIHIIKMLFYLQKNLHKYCQKKDKCSTNHMLKLRWEKFGDIEQSNRQDVQQFCRVYM